jgi:uncharacterized protein
VGDYIPHYILLLKNMGYISCNLKKLNVRFKNLNRISFIIILTLILFLISFCLNYIIGFFKESDYIILNLSGGTKSFAVLFLSPVIIAPIFETFLGQYLPYHFLKRVKYLNDREYLILLISAVFFGLIHFYSVFYIIYAFLLGLVLMYGYMARIDSDDKTFVLVAVSHALLNLGIFIRNLILI